MVFAANAETVPGRGKPVSSSVWGSACAWDNECRVHANESANETRLTTTRRRPLSADGPVCRQDGRNIRFILNRSRFQLTIQQRL
jgi:hypothetical protein